MPNSSSINWPSRAAVHNSVSNPCSRRAVGQPAQGDLLLGEGQLGRSARGGSGEQSPLVLLRDTRRPNDGPTGIDAEELGDLLGGVSFEDALDGQQATMFKFLGRALCLSCPRVYVSRARADITFLTLSSSILEGNACSRGVGRPPWPTRFVPPDRKAIERDPGGPTAPLLSRPIQVEDFMRNPVWVWDLPFAPLTLSETVDAVSALVESRRPSFFITANTHYAMLTKKHPDLNDINTRAAFLVADGAPLVWASRWQGMPLPERVAGSDLIFDLCARRQRGSTGSSCSAGQLASPKRRRGGCVGATPNSASSASNRPPSAPTAEEHAVLVARIRAARPDILFVAFGQPKGEFWIADHLQALGVPVCVQVGASLDFVAGQVRRAPSLLQRLGLEWAYRMWREPRRLGPRYARNARFLLGMVARDLFRGVGLRISEFASSAESSRRIITPGPEGDRDSKGALTSLIGS